MLLTDERGRIVVVGEWGMFNGQVDSFDGQAILPAAHLLGWMKENGVDELKVSIDSHHIGKIERVKSNEDPAVKIYPVDIGLNDGLPYIKNMMSTYYMQNEINPEDTQGSY